MRRDWLQECRTVGSGRDRWILKAALGRQEAKRNMDVIFRCSARQTLPKKHFFDIADGYHLTSAVTTRKPRRNDLRECS